MNQFNISFAGAGRAGSAICRELFNAGYNIDMIVSESERSSRLLAESCNASWSTDLVFPESTQVIVVAVPDQRLKNVLTEIRCHPHTLVIHTAGSYGMDIFPESIKQKGVFYPLQTFTRDRIVSFKGLPFLLESSDDQSSECMKILVESIGGKVHYVDTEHRRILHLAAVFLNNFTNHMLTSGKEVTTRTGISFELFIPLINETISKALTIGPENSQTGPAIRNDQNTIEKHLELLSFSPDLQSIYKDMTQSIIKYYNKKDPHLRRLGVNSRGQKDKKTENNN